jgi:zinc transport system substrate-binding protein
MRIIVMKKIAVAALVVGALSLSGCAAFSDQAGAGPAAPGDRLHVVAAFYPLQYVAQRVVGDRAHVTNLTRPGGEPHDLEIPPKQTAQIVDADLVLYEKGFQPAVDGAVEQNAGGRTVDAAQVADLQPPAHGGHDHGTEDHAGLDPHFWQDPLRLAAVGDAVAAQLATVAPAHADEYAANADALRTDLEALDRAYRTGLGDCTRSTVVVSHDAFGYLAKYGLDMEPIAGLSPGAEPTPADLVRLQKLIDTDGVTTVFSERLASPRLSQSLADDMHVSTAVLDPIEGLSDQTSNETYLSLMEQNLAALRKANRCQ